MISRRLASITPLGSRPPFGRFTSLDANAIVTDNGHQGRRCDRFRRPANRGRLCGLRNGRFWLGSASGSPPRRKRRSRPRAQALRRNRRAAPSPAAAPALTPSPANAKAYFVDLKDGATIAPTTTVHFGLSGMGVAPAGVAKANSGHFHLIIDDATPALDQPIPNDEKHLHYGAGQTEATMTLPAGKHTLQILMGDANHVPHNPPVMSPILHVTVAEPSAAPAPAPAASAAAPGRHPSPKGARVYIESPYNGAYVPTTFTVRFGLAGMGVAPAGFDKPNSGHHHLIVDSPLPAFDQPIPSDENHLHFGAGQTEASVTLPKGRHTLQLLLGDASHVPQDPPVFSHADRCLCRHVAAARRAAAPPAPPAFES